MIIAEKHFLRDLVRSTDKAQKSEDPRKFILALVLIAGFRAGLAGLNLGYPENPPLKARRSS